MREPSFRLPLSLVPADELDRLRALQSSTLSLLVSVLSTDLSLSLTWTSTDCGSWSSFSSAAALPFAALRFRCSLPALLTLPEALLLPPLLLLLLLPLLALRVLLSPAWLPAKAESDPACKLLPQLPSRSESCGLSALGTAEVASASSESLQRASLCFLLRVSTRGMKPANTPSHSLSLEKKIKVSQALWLEPKWMTHA